MTSGLGELDHFTWRSVLPYSLGFDLRVMRVERPYVIEAYATGELEGIGTWRLYAGQGTAIVYDWRVRTTKPWMNTLRAAAHVRRSSGTTTSSCAREARGWPPSWA